MRKIALTAFIIAIVLAASCAAVLGDDFPPPPPPSPLSLGNGWRANDYGHVFSYESDVYEPDGFQYFAWSYDYYLENNSFDHQIVSWVWQHGNDSGNVMPNPHAGTVTDGYEWPLPASTGLDIFDTSYRDEVFDDAVGCVRVSSYVEFEDGYKEYVDVYIPSSMVPAVPEPGSLLAMLSGIIGFVGLAVRRRA